jgi:hypothetical protein
MRNLRRHADALAQRRMRMNRLADVDGIRAHLVRLASAGLIGVPNNPPGLVAQR